MLRTALRSSKLSKIQTISVQAIGIGKSQYENISTFSHLFLNTPMNSDVNDKMIIEDFFIIFSKYFHTLTAIKFQGRISNGIGFYHLKKPIFHILHTLTMECTWTLDKIQNFEVFHNENKFWLLHIGFLVS